MRAGTAMESGTRDAPLEPGTLPGRGVVEALGVEPAHRRCTPAQVAAQGSQGHQLDDEEPSSGARAEWARSVEAMARRPRLQAVATGPARPEQGRSKDQPPVAM